MKLEREFTFDEIFWERSKLMAMYYEWIKSGGMPTYKMTMCFEDDQ